MNEVHGPNDVYEVVAQSDFSVFLQRAEPFLLERETLNNLLWEVGATLDRKSSSEAWFGTVEQRGEICLAGMRSFTKYLILSAGEVKAAGTLARRLADAGMELRGVTGRAETANAFADAWSEVTGATLGRVRSLKIYEWADAEAPARKPKIRGEARRAEEADAEIVRKWSIGFAAESVSPMDPSTLADWAETIRQRGNLYLWVDDEPACMACFGRKTPNGLVVNLVYTPGKRRGNGYAGALLGELLGEAKRRGVTQCCLFSEYQGDRNLYERLGFRKAGEFRERAFVL